MDLNRVSAKIVVSTQSIDSHPTTAPGIIGERLALVAKVRQTYERLCKMGR